MGSSKELKKKGQIIHNSLFFEQILELMFESYSVHTISCFINLQYFGWSSAGEVI